MAASDIEQHSGLLVSSGSDDEVHHAAETAPSNRRLGSLLAAVGATAGVAVMAWAGSTGGTGTQGSHIVMDSSAFVGLTAAKADDGPNWGCGLVGALPGISQDGVASPETQRLIDGIKGSSTYNKASYWNWNLAPQTDDSVEEHLTKDFIFMPEMWGAGVVEAKNVRTANQPNFLDTNGKICPATMAEIFLGMNEPDIYGSCMGNMFGECTAPCDDAAVAANDCPAASLTSTTRAHANGRGECNCWQYAHATGVGFWPYQGCSSAQPLPKLWDDAGCVDTVMTAWKQTAQIAQSKGFKYVTTPLVAANMTYAKRFVEKACAECHDISCGCPQYVAFHFYAYDCQPISTGGYKALQDRLDAVKALMEQYPFIKGAIVNEVGMLNCAGEKDNPICVPDSGKYPAKNDPNHQCPKNSELPRGLPDFVEHIMDMVINAKTSDGRGVVKGFSWFNENMAGGTYNLQLFDSAGKVNEVGESYIKGCSKWAAAQKLQVINA